MFDECFIRGVRFAPARFCAPMAGYTHSAFRRLVAELGGCGAFWTEMLAAKQILKDNFDESPWVRRRPQEGRVVFQLMALEKDPMDRILNRLGEQGVEYVDLNLACDAPAIRMRDAGSALFENFDAMRKVVTESRRHWPGLLTAKIRLGSRRPGWEQRFEERVRFLEEAGVDALTLHPRFFEDKFKRRAKHELIPWAASLTKLPIIANGDLGGPEHVGSLMGSLQSACGLMIGRMAVARPWIFAAWDHPMEIQYGDLWQRMLRYITEDFEPVVGLRRIRMFTKYFSANFSFGHAFYVQILNAPTLEEARARAEAFFAGSPKTVARPSLGGL